jgi:Telomerase ribonucleoprotein complex - RNA binding domain
MLWNFTNGYPALLLSLILTITWYSIGDLLFSLADRTGYRLLESIFVVQHFCDLDQLDVLKKVYCHGKSSLRNSLSSICEAHLSLNYKTICLGMTAENSRTSASIISYASSPAIVAQFCISIIQRLMPSDFWGSSQNFAFFRKRKAIFNWLI